MQHARLLCPPLSPGICSKSCPLSWWFYPSSVAPLLLLLSIFPSNRVFSNQSALRIRWPKYWSFSFSISPYSECPGFISFRIDWFDLLAVQGSLKSLLQQLESINRLVLSLLYGPLSYLHMTTGKTIVLTIWTFIGKVMSLLFNMLSMFVLAFIPRSKHLLISWLQSPWKWRKWKRRHSVTSNSLWHHGL